jgi:serine/threonine-protein kinase
MTPMKPASTRDSARPPVRIGRYLVFAAFARGGMASVHLGRLVGDSGFSRLVAVKRLHPIYASSEAHYKMLLDEARISSRIHHQNVVPTIDVVHENEDLCLVMDYIHGVSLADVLGAARKQGRPVPPPIAAAIGADVLRGLHAAHEATGDDGGRLGIVHRDVSPQNVLVGADGAARVLDFGVAKALRKDNLTISGEVKGKLSYMSPEQLRGGAVTRQADLFATGVLLWEALAGERLYVDVDGEPAAVMLKVLTDVPRPPSERAPGVPRALDAVVLRALSHEPRARFATAEEMEQALVAACPSASREDVARYLEHVAADELARRTRYAREAHEHEPSASGADKESACGADKESASGAYTASASGAHKERASAADNESTPAVNHNGVRAASAPLGHSGNSPPPAAAHSRPAPSAHRRRPLHIVAALAIVVGLVAVGALVGRAFRTRPAAQPAASAAAPEESVPHEPSATPPLDTAPAPAPTDTAALPLIDLDDLPAVRPPRGAPPRTSRPKPRAPNACEPPYSIDANGRKHYKPECLP